MIGSEGELLLNNLLTQCSNEQRGIFRGKLKKKTQKHPTRTALDSLIDALRDEGRRILANLMEERKRS